MSHPRSSVFICVKTDYKGSKEIIQHVDETLKMLSALTGDDSFEKVYNECNERGGVTMCEVVERIRNKGIAIGIEKGRREGQKEGARNKAVENARNLLKINLGTTEQIAEVTSLSLKEVLQLKKELLERR